MTKKSISEESAPKLRKSRTLSPAVEEVAAQPERTPAERGRMALSSSLNAGGVIEAFQVGVMGGVMGDGVHMGALVDGLLGTFKEVRAGDLHTMENMLIGQATALQSIFVSLARRAVRYENVRHYETLLGLALKAQAQSRATISALGDLKYPRQTTFVKQANVAQNQQVNNGTAPAYTPARAEESQSPHNKLLERADDGSTYLDTGAKAAPARSHQAVAAVGKVHRAKKPRG